MDKGKENNQNVDGSEIEPPFSPDLAGVKELRPAHGETNKEFYDAMMLLK